MVDIAIIVLEDLHGDFFFIDTNGELWEYARWFTVTDMDVLINQIFTPSSRCRTRCDSSWIIVFRTTDGRIVERYFNQFSGKWVWVDTTTHQ